MSGRSLLVINSFFLILNVAHLVAFQRPMALIGLLLSCVGVYVSARLIAKGN